MPNSLITRPRVAHKQKDYAAAMTEYRLAGAQEKYGKAFEKERYLFSQQYFLLTVLGIAAALTPGKKEAACQKRESDI